MYEEDVIPNSRKCIQVLELKIWSPGAVEISNLVYFSSANLHSLFNKCAGARGYPHAKRKFDFYTPYIYIYIWYIYVIYGIYI